MQSDENTPPREATRSDTSYKASKTLHLPRPPRGTDQPAHLITPLNKPIKAKRQPNKRLNPHPPSAPKKKLHQKSNKREGDPRTKTGLRSLRSCTHRPVSSSQPVCAVARSLRKKKKTPAHRPPSSNHSPSGALRSPAALASLLLFLFHPAFTSSCCPSFQRGLRPLPPLFSQVAVPPLPTPSRPCIPFLLFIYSLGLLSASLPPRPPCFFILFFSPFFHHSHLQRITLLL